MSDVIVGLDIGTSNVRVVIAEFTEDGALQVTGIGTSPSTGLRKGVVLNIEATLKAIMTAIEAAEQMSGREVESCYVAIGGAQIEGFNSKGLVAVSSKGRESKEIDQTDIDRVIEAARAIMIPIDREILHVIPQDYIVDGQSGIKQPRAMLGVRLEVEVHIVTASVTSTQNIVRCVNRAGYAVSGIMLKTLAAARSVMTEEERNLGSILIDLGGGTTDVLVLAEDAPLCTCSVPIGGQMVTNDISVVKGISTETAELIKLSAGCCWEELVEDQNEEILIPGVGGRAPEQMPRLELCRIIQPRMEEILAIARDRIALQAKVKQLSGNIVLCGAGSLMPGVVDLASQVFETSAVRIGHPAKMGGLFDEYYTPEFATATGIILSYADRRKQAIEDNSMAMRSANQKQSGVAKGFMRWLKEFF